MWQPGGLNKMQVVNMHLRQPRSNWRGKQLWDVAELKLVIGHGRCPRQWSPTINSIHLNPMANVHVYQPVALFRNHTCVTEGGLVNVAACVNSKTLYHTSPLCVHRSVKFQALLPHTVQKLTWLRHCAAAPHHKHAITLESFKSARCIFTNHKLIPINLWGGNFFCW